MTVISRRHLLKFYFTVILGSLFFLGMGIAMIAIFMRISHQDIIKPKEYLMPVFAVAVIFMAVYTIFRYVKNVPKIVIEDKFISFNKEIFSLSDIRKVELTGKRNFKYLINFPMEAATLYFNTGQKKLIFDDMYENSWEMKLYLKQVIIDQKEFIIHDTRPIGKAELACESFEAFKGNQFISLRGISLWGLIGFFLFMILTTSEKLTNGVLIFFALFSLWWFAFHSWLMHYFEISHKFFLVRNQVVPWKKKAFRLSDIKEIVFETRSKMPNCLRIITRDYRNKLYPAGTLRDRTWLDLKERFESHNIRVRNECI